MLGIIYSVVSQFNCESKTWVFATKQEAQEQFNSIVDGIEEDSTIQTQNDEFVCGEDINGYYFQAYINSHYVKNIELIETFQD